MPTETPTEDARPLQRCRVRVHAPILTAAFVLLLALLLLFGSPNQMAFAQGAPLGQIDIPGPAGSVQFGQQVVTLPNGNFVVVDPTHDEGVVYSVGAVYLYDGETLQLISRLTGSNAFDRVGNGGITLLTNGSFVVSSVDWSAGTSAAAGAVTWIDAISGLAGTVSAANSLVGSAVDDGVGNGGVTALPNGNYVVRSPEWRGAASAGIVGAVTWGNGTTGTTGVVSSDNSLVGSTYSDHVGARDITVLSNGNYLVSSPSWDDGFTSDAGAVTWSSGTSGVKGAISAANSLVGITEGDSVGSDGITVLSNGNYVVRSSSWNNGATTDAGAVTWGNGATGVRGPVSVANSLVGIAQDERLGYYDITALSNSNYVVRSLFWHNGDARNVGAVTWGSGTVGVKGPVSPSNSLVGSTASDRVGEGGITALSNGNYVVRSSFWNNGAVSYVGAVTWGDGTAGVKGAVAAENSLVGSTAGDRVGGDVIELSNGNYVVRSPLWSNGNVGGVGAVTWGSGTVGVKGPVSPSNSLVGSTTNDGVGADYVTALSNGNYVVSSYGWSNGAVRGVGAVTWGDGTIGVKGTVSPANSLVGSTVSDRIGVGGVTALSNGNYVVSSYYWSNGPATAAGAVTWGDGATGIVGSVSPANSLVGSRSGDNVGAIGVTALKNGNYVVVSDNWSNGVTSSVGAVTWGSGIAGVKGTVSAANSLVGSRRGDGVGNNGVTALSNGNYVVSSSVWDNSVAPDVGAVTWGVGTAGVMGTISAVNSIVGASASDHIGNVVELSDSDFIVSSPVWDSGANADAGAITWGSGASGGSGVVSASNSFVGSKQGDQIGSGGVTVLPNGQYIVRSPNWDSEVAVDVGAISWSTGSAGLTGPLSYPASARGLIENGGARQNYAFYEFQGMVVVGRPVDNIVTVITPLWPLTLTLIGGGIGSVASTSGAISCDSTCTVQLRPSTDVTLVATPQVGTSFRGWSGACSGTGTCVLTMNTVKSVTATFAPQELQVTIAADLSGGSIEVLEANGMAAATASLDATYPYGTVLRFRATPNEGFAFEKWSGDLSGNQNPLEVTLTAPVNVGAVFAKIDSGNTRVYLPTVLR